MIFHLEHQSLIGSMYATVPPADDVWISFFSGAIIYVEIYLRYVR